MPRDYRANENQKRAKAGRAAALARGELKYPSAPRTAPAGATSFPVKMRDPAAEAAIAEFLRREAEDGK